MWTMCIIFCPRPRIVAFAADIDKNHAVDVEDLLYVLKHYDEVCARQKQPAGEIPDICAKSFSECDRNL